MGRRPTNRFSRINLLQIFQHREEDAEKTAPQHQHCIVETPVLELEMEPSSSSRTWTTSEDFFDDVRLLSSTVSKAQSERSTTTESGSSCGGFEKSVRFGECAVRRYSQVLGDHPCCSVGCPLQLGWDYESLEALTVDDYEANREHHHSPLSVNVDLRLSWEERRQILQDVSDGEVRRACRRLNRQKERGSKRSRVVQKEFFAATV
jgi:hypothetical protein